MWELYDRLIEPIPEDVLIDEILVGLSATMVKAGGFMGITATQRLETRPLMRGGKGTGMSWKEAASLIYSWNFLEAGIGAAAINAYYNWESQIRSSLERKQARELKSRQIFQEKEDGLAGKKVATIGHFHCAEEFLNQAAEVFILEREPRTGDYPDTACEYLLPSMDYVYITGFTLVNKTLPRLLELARGAKVILVGPSVPMAPSLFEFGVAELAGTLITDFKMAEAILLTGGHKAAIRSGRPVRLGRYLG